jgi:protein ImuB
VNRLLVVRCPDLLVPDEDGAVLRLFAEVVETTGAFCPWVTTVAPGLCSLPVRGPARYFGGEEPLVARITEATAALTPVEVGVADGLFAAVLAARGHRVVAAGGTPAFLAPFPVAVLGRPDLAELLARLGLRTLGEFAALPESHVLGRFGADGVTCHRVAGGRSGELDELHPRPGRRTAGRRTAGRGDPVGEPEFWGGVSDADARAGRALVAVQELLGPDGVLTAHLQGGRGPAERARFVTWTGRDEQNEQNEKNSPNSGAGTDPDPGAPWPGRIPPPAPAVVPPTPRPAELADPDGRAVAVSGRGLLTTVPHRLSVAGGPWAAVTAWAGPWPTEERWWTRSARRGARLQAVCGPAAHLLVAEGGRWWVEATYG